jgi:hypothetical protein
MSGEQIPAGQLRDGGPCDHAGESGTYCTRCWMNLYEARQRLLEGMRADAEPGWGWLEDETAAPPVTSDPTLWYPIGTPRRPSRQHPVCGPVGVGPVDARATGLDGPHQVAAEHRVAGVDLAERVLDALGHRRARPFGGVEGGFSVRRALDGRAGRTGKIGFAGSFLGRPHGAEQIARRQWLVRRGEKTSHVAKPFRVPEVYHAAVELESPELSVLPEYFPAGDAHDPCPHFVVRFHLLGTGVSHVHEI